MFTVCRLCNVLAQHDPPTGHIDNPASIQQTCTVIKGCFAHFLSTNLKAVILSGDSIFDSGVTYEYNWSLGSHFSVNQKNTNQSRASASSCMKKRGDNAFFRVWTSSSSKKLRWLASCLGGSMFWPSAL